MFFHWLWLNCCTSATSDHQMFISFRFWCKMCASETSHWNKHTHTCNTINVTILICCIYLFCYFFKLWETFVTLVLSKMLFYLSKCQCSKWFRFAQSTRWIEWSSTADLICEFKHWDMMALTAAPKISCFTHRGTYQQTVFMSRMPYGELLE